MLPSNTNRKNTGQYGSQFDRLFTVRRRFDVGLCNIHAYIVTIMLPQQTQIHQITMYRTKTPLVFILIYKTVNILI